MKVNLIGENTWFKVDITKMSEELREKIIKEANLDSDCIIYDESLDNIEYYGIPKEAVNWSTRDFRDDELELTLKELIGEFPHYMTFYKGSDHPTVSFYNDVLKTVDIDDHYHEVTINKQGKNAILGVDSSMHSSTPIYIVGLTREEYEKLVALPNDDIESDVLARF